MNQFLSNSRRVLEKLGRLFLSEATNARRALLRTEAHERKVNEAERLDRLRNPRDYQGR